MKEKLKYLDGLRGLMAINVIINHFIVFYYPQMYYPEFAKSEGGLLSVFSYSPLSVLVNGKAAVLYFFILTGFLAARSVLLSDKCSLKSFAYKSINRYLRLLPVIAVATVFTFVTMVLGLQQHKEIADIVKNGAGLLSYCNFEPTIESLLKNIFVTPFLLDGKSDYISPFWTIKYEFLGYILVTCVVMMFKNNKFRHLIYFLVLVITLRYDCFFPFQFGAIVADLMYNKKDGIIKIKSKKLSCTEKSLVSVILIAVGLFLTSYPTYIKDGSIWSFYGFFSDVYLREWGICIFFCGLLRSDFLKEILSKKLFTFIGNMSYEIYAFHWPVMLVVEAFLFKILHSKVTYDCAALLSFGLTLPVVFAVSYCTFKLISDGKNYSLENVFSKAKAFIKKENIIN